MTFMNIMILTLHHILNHIFSRFHSHCCSFVIGTTSKYNCNFIILKIRAKIEGQNLLVQRYLKGSFELKGRAFQKRKEIPF